MLSQSLHHALESSLGDACFIFQGPVRSEQASSLPVRHLVEMAVQPNRGAHFPEMLPGRIRKQTSSDRRPPSCGSGAIHKHLPHGDPGEGVEAARRSGITPRRRHERSTAQGVVEWRLEWYDPSTWYFFFGPLPASHAGGPFFVSSNPPYAVKLAAGCSTSRDSMNFRTSSSLQPIRLGEIRTGAGKFPERAILQTVTRFREVISATCLFVKIFICRHSLNSMFVLTQ